MRCKKHLADYSSSVGVCATCLRERLLSIIAAQAQEDSDRARQKPNTNQPPQLLFPRSVSPYISRRKSDTAAAATWHHHQIRSYHSLPDAKFFSTPQIGPTGGLFVDQYRKKKKSNKFGFISSLFRSKSAKPANDSSSTNSRSSPAWLPNFLGKKQSTTFSNVGHSTLKPIGYRDRGMSPEVHSDDECGYTSDEWRRTPRRTPAASVGRRCGGRSTQLSRNVSGISFCLSPMVRASPCRNWSQKGGGSKPEMAVSGEIRVPITTSFYKSGSRKLADIGRSSHNR